MKRLALLTLVLPSMLWASPAEATPICWGQEATIVGTEDSDVIYGNDGADVIHGMGGNDTIKGRGGDDRVCGGDGHDDIFGDKGNDLVGGDADDDWLFGGTDNDKIDGGFGEDSFVPGPGSDRVKGRSVRDSLHYESSTSAIRIYLHRGVAFGQGKDILGMFGDVYGSAYGDTIVGVPGTTWLHYFHGNGGPDFIDMNEGFCCTAYGGNGADILRGAAIEAEFGDYLDGGQGADKLYGLAGDDDLIAEDDRGTDYSNGGKGTDTCKSDAGDAEENCERDFRP